MSLSDKGPLFMLRRRLRKHLAYLASDDALLANEHNGASLTTEEVRAAMRERGLWVINLYAASHDQHAYIYTLLAWVMLWTNHSFEPGSNGGWRRQPATRSVCHLPSITYWKSIRPNHPRRRDLYILFIHPFCYSYFEIIRHPRSISREPDWLAWLAYPVQTKIQFYWWLQPKCRARYYSKVIHQF